MKTLRNNFLSFLAISIIVLAFQFANAQAEEPWKPTQLLAPAELNKILNNPKASQPVSFSIGFQDIIKNSIDLKEILFTFFGRKRSI